VLIVGMCLLMDGVLPHLIIVVTTLVHGTDKTQAQI
jgi:hypothetical protein